MVVASLNLYSILRQFLDDCLTIFRDIIQRRIRLAIQFGIHITRYFTDSLADSITGNSTIFTGFDFAPSNLFRETISFFISQIRAISIGFGIYCFENSIPSYKSCIAGFHFAIAELFLPLCHVIRGKIRSIHIGLVC